MKYLLAHDLGTSGNKATLFTETGELVTSAVYSYETNWFNGVWAEQDPQNWYEAVCSTTRTILKDVKAEDVVAVSFSGQMMGCLCVDANGEPLYPSIIWADMRASEEERFLKTVIDKNEFYKITGHRPSSSYTLAKLLWIKNNQSEVYQSCYKVLNAKDYVIYKLTGEFVTDYSDASGTNLLDINSLNWSQKIAEAVDVDLEKMPALHKSTDIIGTLNEKVSRETGLAVGTSVICGGGDGCMAALGARSISPGDTFCTLGTSAWNGSTSESPVFDEEMRTFNWVHIVPGLYSPCGTMQAAGASLSWLRDQLAQLERYDSEKEGNNVFDRINSTVEEADPGSNGLYYLPYLLGERSPRWNSEARGCFIGLKMETEKKDIFRSIYEGVAFNLEIILRLLLQGEKISSLVMTGGGAMSSVWCQIFADMYDLHISVPNHIEEATSIGAAVTAGVGLGIYDSFDVIKKFIKIEKEYTPKERNSKLYNKMKPVFEELYQALNPLFHQMNRVEGEISAL